MTKAVQISSTGGPEVMSMVDIPLAKPGPGEALVRHHAVGLNYIDVYFRSGVYPAEGLPTVLGMEGAGVVEAVGKGVEHVKPGAAWLMPAGLWALIARPGFFQRRFWSSCQRPSRLKPVQP